MKITINKCEYEILEVNENDPALTIKGTQRCASIHYDTCKIYLADYMNDFVKRNSLIHELTHAFIKSHAMLGVESFDQECVCEFVAWFGDDIIAMANEYFEKKAVK